MLPQLALLELPVLPSLDALPPLVVPQSPPK
jgi:hypothetical protein